MTIERKIGGRPSNRPSKEHLAVLYRNLTAQEISDIYDVSVATVRSWVARYRRVENGGGTTTPPHGDH